MAGQPLVGLAEFFVGHPDTAIGDLNRDPAVGGDVAGNHHVAFRGRKLGGVIQQLRQEVDQVVGCATEHQDRGGLAARFEVHFRGRY